jgi:hypothetical protein
MTNENNKKNGGSHSTIADQTEENEEKKSFIPKGFVRSYIVVIVALLGVDILIGMTASATASAFIKSINTVVKNIQFIPSYIALALVGVAFHITKQVRERREKGIFNWDQYKSDYIFRMFQASVYVIILYSVAYENGKGSHIPLTLFSLFIGMYIRRVEEVFENFGDRFGDTLRGILGASAQRLSVEERSKKIDDLRKQLLDLIKTYDAKRKDIAEEQCKNLDELIKQALGLIQQGDVEKAEKTNLDLKFQIASIK